MAVGYAYPWMTFSADALHENGFARVASLLRGASWNDAPAEEIAVAYDFLGDLYVDTGDEDVQRTALFLGRCQRIGIELAFAEAAAPVIREPDERPVVIKNRRIRRAELRGEIARAMKESLSRQRREERRVAKRRAIARQTTRERVTVP